MVKQKRQWDPASSLLVYLKINLRYCKFKVRTYKENLPFEMPLRSLMLPTFD